MIVSNEAKKTVGRQTVNYTPKVLPKPPIQRLKLTPEKRVATGPTRQAA